MSETSCRQCTRIVEGDRATWATPVCFLCLPPPKPLPVARTHGEWREMIERALGLDPDPVNHTMEWCEETLVRVRELGNAGRRELMNAWCRGVDDAIDEIPGGDEYATPIATHIDRLKNPYREGAQ